MTHIATCGHDITYAPRYLVTRRVMVNNLGGGDNDPALIEAEETGVYCERCVENMFFFDADFVEMEQIE